MAPGGAQGQWSHTPGACVLRPRAGWWVQVTSRGVGVACSVGPGCPAPSRASPHTGQEPDPSCTHGDGVIFSREFR